MNLDLLKLAYIIGIGIGGLTASGYPPFDPSVWLVSFCLGGLWSCFEIEEKIKEKQ